MRQTRREFLVTLCIAGILPAVAPASSRLLPAGGRRNGRLEGGGTLLEGDPYLAFVDEGGLGGRTFDEKREYAMRFRSTPDDRDKYVLGLEI